MLLLEKIYLRQPTDPRAPYYLGNFLYDRRRYDEAIARWESAAALDPSFPTAWRNLGLAYFNISADPDKALAAYDKALTADPSDARVLYERDQLWKRVGEKPEKRLAELNHYPNLLALRDDLAIEHATLLNQTGKPTAAFELLTTRAFQPWRAVKGWCWHSMCARPCSLENACCWMVSAWRRLESFHSALHPPRNLSEARHLLANASDIHFWIGKASAPWGTNRRLVPPLRRRRDNGAISSR